jgi:poly-gamma-glutamate synthesis protein (capsule biosynthesis protein)
LIYHAENGAIRMLLTGDAMPSRRLTPFDEPDYLTLVELLRSADISFVNLETTVRNRDEARPAGRRARR